MFYIKYTANKQIHSTVLTVSQVFSLQTQQYRLPVGDVQYQL